MGQFSVEKPVAPGSVLSGNQQTYFTGDPCKAQGHVSERCAREGKCLACRRGRDAVYLSTHRAEKAAYCAAHYSTHKAERATYRAENRASILAKQASYRAENRDARNAKQNDYRRTPHGKAVILSHNAARRAREKEAMPRWTDKTFAKGERRTLAGLHKGKPHRVHLDHIYPLAGATYTGPDPEWQGVQISVGLEVSWNYQHLPDWLNGSKGAKLPPPGYMDWFDHHTNETPRAAGDGEWAGWPEEYYD